MPHMQTPRIEDRLVDISQASKIKKTVALSMVEAQYKLLRRPQTNVYGFSRLSKRWATRLIFRLLYSGIEWIPVWVQSWRKSILNVERVSRTRLRQPSHRIPGAGPLSGRKTIPNYDKTFCCLKNRIIDPPMFSSASLAFISFCSVFNPNTVNSIV